MCEWERREGMREECKREKHLKMTWRESFGMNESLQQTGCVNEKEAAELMNVPVVQWLQFIKVSKQHLLWTGYYMFKI